MWQLKEIEVTHELDSLLHTRCTDRVSVTKTESETARCKLESDRDESRRIEKRILRRLRRWSIGSAEVVSITDVS